MKVEEVVLKLGLEPLDREGGWFKRVHTGDLNESGRPISTTIYALFTPDQFSALHRLDAAEQFFLLGGDAFEVLRLETDGSASVVVLGNELEKDQHPHMAFPSGCWFGGRPVPIAAYGWSLISAVVTPGFEWSGFELGDRNALVGAYPEFQNEILALTRDA